MLLKRRMSNEERGTENGERTREPESFDIIHSQFPSVLSRFHYHFHVSCSHDISRILPVSTVGLYVYQILKLAHSFN